MTKVLKDEKTKSQNTTLPDKAVIGTIETTSRKKSSQVSPRLVVLAFVILLVIILSGWLVYRSSLLSGLFAKTVCGEEIVNSYNSLSTYALRDESEDLTVDIEGLQALAAEITAKEEYQDDPTCQIILLEIALFNSDYTSALNALTVVEELSDKNQNADENINRMATLEEYQVFVRQITPSTSKEIQEPQGGE